MKLRGIIIGLSLFAAAYSMAADEESVPPAEETATTNAVEDSALPERLRYQDKIDWHMVAIEALVIEVDEERARQLGFNYGLSTLDSNGGDASSVLDGANVGIGPSAFTPASVATLTEQLDGRTSVGFANRMPGLGISLAGMNVDTGVISAELRALVDHGEAIIRTRPVGVALNKTKVKIETVDELPYVDINSGGNLNIQKKTVGVKLEVTPYIEPDYPGAVTLDISNIEVSSGSRFMTLQDIDRPVITLSKTKTKVTLREGETFVIGGLKTRRKTVEEKKVPILGHIPVIKWLFTSRHEVVRNVDILFFITPNILEPGENFLLPYDFENREFLGVEPASEEE
ncbi:MAG: hypothetical protein JXR40_02295 [Pontiellaceae bacterium]|nr:hypothetical protein [Pontiellaceae bacterium]